MNPPQIQRLPDPLKMSGPLLFNVTIIYETASDGMSAKRFSDQLATEVAGEYELIVNLNVWNFQVIGIPEIRNTSASTAALADVVIFAMSQTKALPRHVEDWIEMWSWLIDRGDPAVIMLVAGTVAPGAPVHAELKRAAMRKGLDFFRSRVGGASEYATARSGVQ